MDPTLTLELKRKQQIEVHATNMDRLKAQRDEITAKVNAAKAERSKLEDEATEDTKMYNADLKVLVQLMSLPENDTDPLADAKARIDGLVEFQSGENIDYRKGPSQAAVHSGRPKFIEMYSEEREKRREILDKLPADALKDLLPKIEVDESGEDSGDSEEEGDDEEEEQAQPT
ncbi:hypothetical protein G7Y89_g6445 [Cudoniella acicularis]|uniref:Uncharacterized protein n=1 Tax=Cudoniella acicularis TaxID=354080 RepID=A0A8H4RLA5_9HELO|nr:hypothetical protein G7Y89_g6445 [Cudoniella acicularis]